MKFLMRIIVTSVIAFGLSYMMSGIHIDTFWTAIVLAVVLAVLNAILRPILVFLTFPLTLITFGLFLFVINAIIILLAAKFVPDFKVDGFWWALLFSLLLSLTTSLLYREEETKEDD